MSPSFLLGSSLLWSNQESGRVVTIPGSVWSAVTTVPLVLLLQSHMTFEGRDFKGFP